MLAFFGQQICSMRDSDPGWGGKHFSIDLEKNLRRQIARLQAVNQVTDFHGPILQSDGARHCRHHRLY